MSTMPAPLNDCERLTTPEVIATTRDAYATSEGTVIKVPQKDWHVEMNEFEVEHWQQIQDDSILAPIIDHADDYSWVEMPRCRRLEEVRDESLLEAFIDKMSDRDFLIQDLHIGNIGILPSNNEVVCYDYSEINFNQ